MVKWKAQLLAYFISVNYKFHRRWRHGFSTLGQGYLLSQSRLEKQTLKNILSNSFFLFQAFAFSLFKREYLFALLTLMRAWFTGLMKNYLNMLLRLGMWGWRESHAEIPVGRIIHAQHRNEIFFKLGICFMEYSSHLRLCLHYFLVSLQTNCETELGFETQTWNTILSKIP